MNFRVFIISVFVIISSPLFAQGVIPGPSGPITAVAGSFAAGSLVDGADLTQGTKTDTPCTLPATSLSCSLIAIVKAQANAANGSVPAGSAYIGQFNTASQYPNGAVPVTGASVGTTGALTTTLAAVSGKTTYVCGFTLQANATAASTAPVYLSNVITGTMDFLQYTAAAASGIGTTQQTFNPCIPASATNTAITMYGAAPGAGGNTTLSLWGYQL